MTCDWRQEDWDNDCWQTTCGEAFSIIEGKPSENNMKFCCYCGKPLVEHPYTLEDADA